MSKIINFHKVSDSSWFDRVIVLLKSRYNMITIAELESIYFSEKEMMNVCHITFDDGDLTFYNVIYPILKKYKVPASIYVSPRICLEEKNFWFQEIRDYESEKIKEIIAEYLKIDKGLLVNYSVEAILKNLNIDKIWHIINMYQKLFNIKSKEPQNMNQTQFLTIDKEGLVVLGAHTLSHPILANENDSTSGSEIIDSINGLQEILNHEVNCFAYPNGIPEVDFGEREINYLRNTNCRIAFSTEAKDFTSKENPYAIPRYGFTYGNEYFLRAKLILGEYWPKLKNLKSDGEKEERKELKEKLRNYR